MNQVLPFSAPLTKCCTKCGVMKPETLEHFYKQSEGRRGLSAECRDCKKRRMGPVNRRFYAQNREAILLRVYSSNDAKADRITDVTAEWMRENITSKPCFYCGTEDAPRGCDRLDNDLGHVTTNVVPCCKLCNKTRNNHFTPAEMKLIGATVAVIRKARQAERHIQAARL